MPLKAPTPCRYPGCRAVLAIPGYCDRHRAAVHRVYGRARRWFDEERTFYASTAWRAVRETFLRAHPLCCRCGAEARLTPARVVDHVTPIKDGGARFEWSNLQALCVPCHNAKTARESAQRLRKPSV